MSFGFTGFFRAGAWREFRRFVLEERSDALGRIRAINAELVRIGEVVVYYGRSDPSDPDSPMSESRIGFSVTPNSSLERLIQAYVANGGNPFDISMFLIPDSFQFVSDETEESSEFGESTTEPTIRETQPYGGIASPRTADGVMTGLYTGGWLPMWRYPPRKFGNNISYVTESAEMAPAIRAARDWVSQEIKTKRNDLEARIIKLADLREQLLHERDEVLPQAVGNVVPGIPFGTDFAISFHVSSIVNTIDQVFYPLGEDGEYNLATPRGPAENPPYPVLLEDAPTGEEDWTELG